MDACDHEPTRGGASLTVWSGGNVMPEVGHAPATPYQTACAIRAGLLRLTRRLLKFRYLVWFREKPVERKYRRRLSYKSFVSPASGLSSGVNEQKISSNARSNSPTSKYRSAWPRLAPRFLN